MNQTTKLTSEWQVIQASQVDAATDWTVPPACQGQIVEVSYAADEYREVIYRRTLDRSDMSESFEARLSDADEAFEPWNVEPR